MKTITNSVEGWIYFTLFIGCVFLGNYLISSVGVVCSQDGPCVIPVWPGIMAPSGVLAIGLGFTLRDLVQRQLGVKFTLLAIIIGAIASAIISPSLALASGAAFLLSETLDLFVYTPLVERNLFIAVIGSNIVGIIADSAIFLWLAYGSLNFVLGQIIGKFWMTLIALPVIWLIRRHDSEKNRIQSVKLGEPSSL